ncbi:hypothetical protein BRD56_02670 [Thermoplasmatales archaeon SW_10_69_26]|nr:MAG: hypothetical protein BRD56_02670 [Thermoplasmatales archaeon SW_10_69_26]
MIGTAWDASGALAVVLALAIVVPPAGANIDAGAAPTPAVVAPEPMDAELAQPLVKLATTPGEIEAIHAGHAAGHAWAQTTLAEPPRLAEAVDALYEAHGLAHADTLADVPAPAEGPLATLVTLAAHHAANTGPYADVTDETTHATTLGAIDPIRDELREIRHDLPADPIVVDPLGLVVLGGSGDNTYTPNTVGPTVWQGPLILVEPAGDDTYDIPVAAPTTIHRPDDPLNAVGNDVQYGSFALEFEGNDTYTKRTASADLGPATNAILLDERGNDTYSQPHIERTTAHASPGFAYLLDEQGHDTYHGDGHYEPPFIRTGSIAFAHRASTAILWDQRGNDTYQADDDAHFSHAMAHSQDAGALLWDEEGNDIYIANQDAFASSWNDAVARFVDERGDDTYDVFSPRGDFGSHYEQLSPRRGDSTLNRGLGEFVDARGQDTYTWDPIVGDSEDLPTNNETHVDHREDRKWGVFIDCQTPADADRPCEEEQHEARCTIVRHPAEVPSPLDGLLSPAQHAIDERCRSAGP